MREIKNKFNNCKCEDNDKKYLDKAGVGLILELLLSADAENSSDIKDLENRLENIPYEDLEIGGLKYNTKEYKKVLVDLSYGKNDEEDVIWLSVGEYNEDGTPNTDSLEKVASLPIDNLVKDKFLDNVEVEEDRNGDTYVVFSFNTKNEDDSIRLPIKDIFSSNARYIKLDEISVSIIDNDGLENVIVIESGTNIHDALKSLWERVLENDLDIKRIFEELASWEPISESEISYMFNIFKEQNDRNTVNSIESGKDVILHENLYVKGGSLNITGEYQTIDLNGFEITGEGSSEYKDLIIISNIEDNTFTDCTLENGKITGVDVSRGATEYTSTVLIQGNSNVVIENLEIRGIHPLYLLAENEINLTIKSGKFIAYGPEAVYVQNDNTRVIIEDGYFESIHPECSTESTNEFLLNINNECKNSTIEIIGGEFINYNPIKFLKQGYKIESYRKENKNIYKVVEED